MSKRVVFLVFVGAVFCLAGVAAGVDRFAKIRGVSYLCGGGYGYSA